MARIALGEEIAMEKIWKHIGTGEQIEIWKYHTAKYLDRYRNMEIS